MKPFLTTIIAILLFTVTGRAQWTLTSGNIYPTVTTNNVAVGTTSPEAGFKIDVNGLGAVGTQGSARIYLGTVDATHAMIQSRNTTVNQNLIFYASAYNFTTGNVGIGTATPITKLDVAVNTTATDGLIVHNLTNTTYGTFMAAGSSAGGSNWANSMVLESVPVSTGGFVLSSYTGNITFQTSSRTNRMTITSAGNVGIGTTSPDQALSVNGTVHSKAVVVDNSIFPDYVFKKTYVLRPLSAVKTYIDLNHHLPEMPSAAEVAKNGQNLGEINTLLLKKVEELTLYMINEHKANETLQTQLSELKSQMKLLIKELNIKEQK